MSVTVRFLGLGIGIAAVAAAAIIATSPFASGDPTMPEFDRGDQRLWQQAWTIASDSQRPALEDGAISFQEYAHAADRTVACINQIDGLRGEAPFNENTGVFLVAARSSDPPLRAFDEEGRLKRESSWRESARAETDACYAEHWNGIHQAWTAQRQPGAEEVRAAREALTQCLHDAGLDIEVSPEPTDLRPYMQSAPWGECTQAVEEEFGIPYFAG